MNILNSMQASSKPISDTRVNIAVQVTGYNFDSENPDNNRIIGKRIDTKEIIEVHVNKITNRNQPTVEAISQNVFPGGTVIIAGAYVNSSIPKQENSSAYVMTGRWPRMLTPSKAGGRSTIAMAKIQTPFVQEDGRITMNVFVQGTQSYPVKSIQEFENAFFHTLNPENSLLGAIPYSAVRVFQIDADGNKIDGRLQQFAPAFTDTFLPQSIQNTFNKYKQEGTKEHQHLNQILQTVELAIKDPNHFVEIVPLHKFTVGSKTKDSISQKMGKDLNSSTWECVPTNMKPLTPESKSLDGYTKCIIGLRQFAKTNNHYVCGAMPSEINPVITATGVITLADKTKQTIQKEQSQQAPQQTPQQPVQQNYQQQTPQQPVQQNYQQQAPQQPVQQNNQQRTSEQIFYTLKVNDLGQLTINPPNQNDSLENSVYQSLSMFRSSINVEENNWVFQLSDKENVIARLDEVLAFSRELYPNVGTTIDNTLTPIFTTDTDLDNIDFDALSNEVDNMFSTEKSLNLKV
jgi:hypothetical protein